MKRLLSLLLVIAMLFGVCTVFTACDNASVSDEEDDGDKKKEEKKDTFQGLEIGLPKSFKKGLVEDGYAIYSNDKYSVHISYSVNTMEQSAKEFQEELKENIEYELDEGFLEEGDVGKTDKGTRYAYVVYAGDPAASVIAFYATDNSYWIVQINSADEDGDYDIQQMIKYITDWKYSDPKVEDENDDNGDDNGDIGNNEVQIPTAATNPGSNQEQQQPTEEAPSPDATMPNIGIEGDVVYDNMGIMILYTGYYTYATNTCYQLAFINNSGYDVEVECSDFILNDVAFVEKSDAFYVRNGSITTSGFTIYNTEMEHLCLDYLCSANFTVNILNCADYEYLLIGDSARLETGNYSYEQPMDSYGVTLTEEEGLRVILQGFELDGEDNSNMWLYIENNNDVPVSMDLGNFTINNWTISAIYGSAYVLPHTYTVVPVDVYDLVKFGIYDEDSIHNLKFTMTFYDASGYYGYEICTVNAYYCPGYADIVQDMPADSIVLYDGYAFELRLFAIESYYSNAVVRLLMCNYRDDIPVTVRIENIVINGQPISDEFYEDMDVEARHLTDMWLFSNEEIGFNGVKDLQSLSFTLIVLDHTHYPIFEEVIEVPIY